MLPPGPRAPAVVQLARWIVRPLPLMRECQRDFGDVFTLRGLRDTHVVVVADPELVKGVMSAEPDTLLAGVGNALLLEPMLGKHSLLTLDGADHLRQRRLLLPAFHGDRLKAYAPVIRSITEAAIRTWPVARPFALHSTMQSITLDVILQTVFGLGEATRQGELRARLIELLDTLSNPWLLFGGAFGVNPFKIPWLHMTKLKRALDDALYQMIALRRAENRAGTDVLSMMLQARDEDGEPMSDVEIRDELVTLLLAGHETTATALAWTFDQLLAHPQVLGKMREELAAGRDDYLDAVIRETLRVRPIVPLVGRYVAKPYQLGSWKLPVGTQIAPSIYLSGHRADAYPEPERYRPERWLGVKPDPYTWLPFGGGIRRCIGMAFAQLEMRVVIQTIVTSERSLALVGGPAKVVRRGITLAPAGGRTIVTSRASARPSDVARS